jgi:hypothetical protein
MAVAEAKFNAELENLRGKVESTRAQLALKDMELVKMMEQQDNNIVDLEKEKAKTEYLNGEIDHIVSYFNK